MSLGLGLKLPVLAGKRPFFGSAAKAIKRYITELSAAGSMYDQFSSPIVLDGDFEWEMEYFGNAEDYAPLIGSTLDNDQLARVQAGGFLRVRSSGGNATSSTIISTGKSYLLGGRRVGNTLSVLVNSVEESSYTNDSVLGTTTIDAIMAHSGVFADGGWLNLKIWKGGDRTTGTLVMDATKDGDGTSNIIVNAAGNPYLTRVNQTTDEVTLYTVEEGNYLGPEMWTYGDYTYTGDEAEYTLLLGNYGAGGGIEAGKAYRWSYAPDLSSSYATSQIRLRLGEGSVSTLTRDSTDGTTYSGIAVMAVDESKQGLLLQTGADPQFESGTVTGISVKRLIEVA
jgi:hypothetical protein